MASGLSQATSQLKSMGAEAQSSGQKVKQSGVSIGAGMSIITMNLVNTAQQVIGLKRQWEDLTRMQNNVVQSDNALENAKGKLKVATINLQNAKKGESGATKRELQEAGMQLKADLKGAKSKLDVMKAHDKYNKVLNQGGKDTDQITKKQIAYDRALRGVQNATINDKEAHVNLKRAVEDFYLNTIPTAIGIIGSGASVFQVFQKSGIGLAGALGKLAIPIGAIALGALAIKTNFLGVTDFLNSIGKSLGDQIPALKPFLEILTEIGELLGLVPAKKGTKAGGGLNKAIADLRKEFDPLIKGFQSLVDAIMKGDWGGAFNIILNAAKTFWANLKIAVPFLGFIEGVIANIRNGQWGTAFNAIYNAALKFWADLKVKVPFLADVEAFITALSKGEWSKAFAAVMKGWQDSGIPVGLELLFGKNWKSGLDAAVATFFAEAKLKAAGPVGVVMQVLADVNAFIISVTGFDVSKWIREHPLPDIIVQIGATINGVIKSLTGFDVAEYIKTHTLPQAIVDIGITLNGAIKALTGFDIAAYFKTHSVPDAIVDIGITLNGAIKALTGFDIAKYFETHSLTDVIVNIGITLNGVIKALTGFDVAKYFETHSVPDAIVDVGTWLNATIKGLTGGIDIGYQIQKWFTDHPVTGSIPFFGGITMMVDDPTFRQSIIDGLNVLGTAMADLATTLDPHIADMINNIDFSGGDWAKAAQTMWDQLWKGLNTSASQANWQKLIADAIVAVFKSKTAAAVKGALGETPLAQGLKGAGLSDKPLTQQQINNLAKGGPFDQARKAGVELNPVILAQQAWDWLNKALTPQSAAGGSPTSFNHPLTGQQGAYGGPGPGTGQQGAYGGPGPKIAPKSTIPTAPYVMPAPDMGKFYAAIDTGVKRIQDLTGIVASTALALPGVDMTKFYGSIDSGVKRVMDLAAIVASTVIALPGVNTIKFTGSIDSAVRRVQDLGSIVQSTPIALPGVNTIKFTGSIDSAVRRVQGLAQIVASTHIALPGVNTIKYTSSIDSAVRRIQDLARIIQTTQLNMPGVNLTKFFNSMDIIVRRVQGVQAIINSLHGKNVTNTITTVHRTIYAAKGFHGMVSGPTSFMAGERGKEWVDVTPMSGSTSQSAIHDARGPGRGRGGLGRGSGAPQIIQLVVDGRVLADVVLNKMTTRQGAYK